MWSIELKIAGAKISSRTIASGGTEPMHSPNVVKHVVVLSSQKKRGRRSLHSEDAGVEHVKKDTGATIKKLLY